MGDASNREFESDRSVFELFALILEARDVPEND